jgi:UPF0271 protein
MEGEKGPRNIVCDTSVLLAGGDPRSSFADQVFITPAVIGEIQRPDDKDRLETLRETGLQVREPSAASRGRVGEAAKTTGDGARLSAVDVDLLALALDLNGELLTDDRSMQNVAKVLQITYRGFAQSEIVGLWHWQSIIRCIGCGRTFEQEPPRGECIVCGHQVKKKHWRVPKGEAAGGKRRRK